MYVHISLPSPKSCSWLQKKVASVHLGGGGAGGMPANPFAPAASPEASLGMCVAEEQSPMWQLGDWPGHCRRCSGSPAC